MHPVLLRWRGFKIYSYPAMLYLGLVFGIVGGNYVANLSDLDSARVFVATLVLLVPALAGARLLFVASHWDIYRHEPWRIWRRSEGGAAMYGGLPFALLISVPLLWVLRVPFGAFWDVMTFTILIGMVFTRVGCLLNGCCAGRSTDSRFALYLPDAKGVWRRRIPTPLLEAGWGGLLLTGAAVLRGRTPFPGTLFLYLLVGYGAGRLWLETTREKQRYLVGKMTVDQAVSLVLVIVPLAILLVGWLGQV